ncbi:MAG: hypothetical protein IAI50_10055 [Candidatus Eremiobacteraeota bacterium]|nr:hypothetical protein [Candidatus Eremiobacteraeota bacterium]
MWRLLTVCGAILLLLVVSTGLYAAGMPGYQAVAFTLFGGVVSSVLLIAILLSIGDRTRHVD